MKSERERLLDGLRIDIAVAANVKIGLEMAAALIHADGQALAVLHWLLAEARFYAESGRDLDDEERSMMPWNEQAAAE